MVVEQRRDLLGRVVPDQGGVHDALREGMQDARLLVGSRVGGKPPGGLGGLICSARRAGRSGGPSRIAAAWSSSTTELAEQEATCSRWA